MAEHSGWRAPSPPPPTLLVLEDLHWADEATLDVIALLAIRISSAPVLVLVSFRDDQPDTTGHLRYLLGELVRRAGRLKVDRRLAEARGSPRLGRVAQARRTHPWRGGRGGLSARSDLHKLDKTAQ